MLSNAKRLVWAYCRVLRSAAIVFGKTRLLVLLVVMPIVLVILRLTPPGTVWQTKQCPISVKSEGEKAAMAFVQMQKRDVPISAQRYKSFQREAPLQIVDRGENIKAAKAPEVHVMDAIQRSDYPVPGAFNAILVTWVYNHTGKHGFVCCFTNSTRSREVVAVPAKRLFLDTRYHPVNMRFALFACTVSSNTHPHISNKNPSNVTSKYFNYVAFAEKTCSSNMTLTAHKVSDTGKLRLKQFAVCLKVAYGQLSPQKLVEWFELAKIVGVAIVHVYYHIISDEVMTVFRYYEKTGFAVLSPVFPAAMKGHPPRGFQRPRMEWQAWMDGTVVCNDCLHRFHNYHFVAIMDLDELLLPSPPFRNLYQVMQAAVKQFPAAGAFYIESYIVLLDWPETDNTSSINFLRHLDRTKSSKLDNSGHGKSSPKVIYRPHRVLAVSTHDGKMKGNYTKQYLPKNSHKFLHYRSCKEELWKGCPSARRRDTDILRFKSRWVQAVNKLPLLSLHCGKAYVDAIARDAKRLAKKKHGA